MVNGSLSVPIAMPTRTAVTTPTTRARGLRAAKTATTTAQRPITLGSVWEMVAGAHSSTW